MLDIDTLLNKEQLFDGHYRLLRTLSTDGATADVWLALDVNTIDNLSSYEDSPDTIDESSGMTVAIKIYRPKNALDIEGEQRFRDEFKVAFNCHHANLLQPTSFNIYKGVPYLVLPYCEAGSSEQFIGKELSEEKIWKFILDVSSGLDRLHSNHPQIIHQDIKPANILIDDSGDFTITDFGISTKKTIGQENLFEDENSGTMAYMAPERFSSEPTPIPESDIWAFGATLCEILTGSVPFGENGGQSQLEGVPMVSLSHLPTSIRKLIRACLQKAPQKRPSASEIAKAARAKHFPIKKKHPILIALLFIFLLSAAGSFYYLMRPKPVDPVYQPTKEELFEKALIQLNHHDSKTAHNGLRIMDSLSRCEYIPAMYEVAYTYGWFTDSLSWHRKEVLQIEMDEFRLPKSIKDKTKAKDLFDGILELNDTTYAEINSKAAYRLAIYYGDRRITKNGVYDDHIQEVNNYLDISEQWATLSNDKELLHNIAITRNYIEEQQQNSQTEIKTANIHQ